MNLSRLDLSGFDLSGFDLSGFDLSGFDLSGFDLSRSDLSGLGEVIIFPYSCNEPGCYIDSGLNTLRFYLR